MRYEEGAETNKREPNRELVDSGNKWVMGGANRSHQRIAVIILMALVVSLS